MYWAQGEENLPFLVQACVSSWRVKNPGWELKLLDRDSLPALIDLEDFDARSDIGLQALSDIIRVKLLMRYGGVWADASLFCAKPLDDWLPPVIDDGFFAFASHRKDRLMTTWFLAGNRDSQLLSAWGNEIFSYWRSHTFRSSSYWTKQVLRKLMSLRKREITSNDFWFSSLVLGIMKIYPYPVNMYLFERTLDRDQSLKKRWFDRRVLFDEPAEHLQNNLGMNALATEQSKAFLTRDATPVHKLNWRQDIGHAEKSSNFEYLIQGLNRL